MSCGYYAVNNKHCMNGNHCIVCSYEAPRCLDDTCDSTASITRRGYCVSHYMKRYRANSPRQALRQSYGAMKSRCSNKNNKNYKYYGGRGIEVVERWMGKEGFKNFVSDMGPRPTLKHTVDRIDSNGNYEPSNCRWADKHEQIINRRTTVFAGVGKIKSKNRWYARLQYGGRVVFDRSYATKESAIKARLEAEMKYLGREVQGNFKY